MKTRILHFLNAIRCGFWNFLCWLFVPERALIVAAMMVAAVYIPLYFVAAPIPPNTAFYDKAILWIIAFVFSAGALVMLFSRRAWTLRAVGLLLLFMGVAVLSWNAVYVRSVGYTVKNERVVPNADPGVQEAIGDLWRTLLLVGGPLLMVGLIGYVIGRFGPRFQRLFNRLFGGRVGSNIAQALGIQEDVWIGIERRSSSGRRQEDRDKDDLIEALTGGSRNEVRS